MVAFFNTVILLGCVQGCIVSGLLFFSSRKRYANRLLAVLILLMSLASFNLYATYVQWFGSHWAAFAGQIIPLVMVMPMGPLLFFYNKSFLDPAFRLSKKQYRHFYPVLIDFIPGLTVVVFLIGLVTHTIKNNPAPWGVFIDNFNVYADVPRWLSLTVYCILSYRLLQQLKNGSGNAQSREIRWLSQFCTAFLTFIGIWLLYLVPYVIPKYTDRMLNTFDWYPVYIPLAILIYWLGFKGYAESLREKAAEKKSGGAPALQPGTVKAVSEKLLQLMDADRLYLRQDLNIASLAAAAGYSPRIISLTLNQHLQTSFNDFINGYRIRAFTEKIRLPEMDALTIAAVAAECGFNSPATFQRTCRELTGKPPSAFRKAAPTGG